MTTDNYYTEMAHEQMDMLNEIKNIQGSNAKFEVMKAHMERDWVSALTLYYLLNPLAPSGIGKKSWNNTEPKTLSDEPGFIDLVDWLAKGGHSSNNDIAFVKGTEKFFGEISYVLATKDISLGVSASSYNKVAKEIGLKLIPVINPMLSKNINSLSEKKLNNVLESGVYITTKLDGIRAIAMFTNNQWKVFGRSGREITGLEHITTDLDRLINVSEGRIYDGELIVPSDNLNAEDAFNITSGVVNSNGDKTNVVFHVFDAPKREDFFGFSSKPELYTERIHMVRALDHNNTSVQSVPLLGVAHSMEEVDEIFSSVIEKGEEGVMLNQNAAYVPKRTNTLLKMKQENTVDLRVTGIEEGTGRLANTLGALIVDYKGSELRVGTGLSDMDRALFWNTTPIKNDPDDIIGKIIEVGYTTESKDKNGKLSLRFPRFVRVREDKNEVNYD